MSIKHYSQYLEGRWSCDVLERGWTCVPNTLIANRVRLGLSSTDMYIVIVLLHYQWDNRKKPYPSLITLSVVTGFSPRQISRSTTKLEYLGLIDKERRFGSSNVYDLSPINKLLERML